MAAKNGNGEWVWRVMAAKMAASCGENNNEKRR
jgi:hypothetical protein